MDSSSGYLPLPLNQYVGVKFRPTDQQLLHYLYCKIYGQPYFQGVIFDFDLYGGTEPWEIWQSFNGIDDEDLYFFTKLKRSKTNSGHLSAHINRKIGLANGTWSGENSASPIFANEDDEQIIGYRKRFRYENEQLEEHHGEWIMHEYSMHQEYLTSQGVESNYVLCRIRKNERAKRKLETQRELQQPQKKRIMAAKIPRIERPKTKAKTRCFVDQLQPPDQRVMTSKTIYNSDIMPDMTTHQNISVVDHMSNMNTNQDNIDTLDTPLMVTNEITSSSNEYVSCKPTDNEWKDFPNFYYSNDFEQRVMIPHTIESSNFMPDMTTNFDSGGVDHTIDMATNQENVDGGVVTRTDMTTNQDNVDILDMLLMLPDVSTEFGNVDIPYVDTYHDWKDSLDLGELNDIDFPSYVQSNFDETSCIFKP